ncbi:MAG: invasin domain 3-containing protein, partial [Candidatus Eremiobacterota bacterium]
MRLGKIFGVLAAALIAVACTSGSPETVNVLVGGEFVTVSLVNSSLTLDRPTGVVADGADMATVTLLVRDTANNPVPGLAVGLQVSGSGNIVRGPAATTDANGMAVATIASTVAETKTLTGSVNGQPVEQTATVTFVAGPPARLNFAVQPTAATTTSVIVPAVQVSVEDAHGNRNLDASVPVTLNLASNPGSASLLGTTSVTTVSGLARFEDLLVDLPGNGYTLRASSPGLSDATSQPFDISTGSGGGTTGGTSGGGTPG